MTNDSTITIFQDPEIIKLKIEIQNLEIKITNLSDEKITIEKLIHDFTLRHNKELGSFLLKILEFRRDRAKGTPKATKTEEDYNRYNEEKIQSDKSIIQKLTKEEEIEIKKLYRKVSKLCHPDVVNDLQKDLAHKIFSEANQAYEANNLIKLVEILDSLEKGNFFSSKSDLLSETSSLKSEIIRLESIMVDLSEELKSLRNSKSYQTIINIADWDIYFEENKLKLEKQIQDLSYGQ